MSDRRQFSQPGAFQKRGARVCCSLAVGFVVSSLCQGIVFFFESFWSFGGLGVPGAAKAGCDVEARWGGVMGLICLILPCSAYVALMCFLLEVLTLNSGGAWCPSATRIVRGLASVFFSIPA